MENRFIEENYIKELVKINIVWANIFGIIVLAVAMILFGIPFYLFWYQEYPVSNTTLSLLEWLKNISIIFLLFITGIIAHELIHGVVFAVYSENKFKSIKFGVMPASKLFTPYCHCKEVLNIRHYRIALIMPSILLGIIPAMISIIIGNIFLLFWGVVFIMAGGGDILMFVKTLKEKKDSWILDHPTEAGYYVYKQISKENKEN
ncbi:MAG: DUF3267 domain-containing protein [Treponema sp.]|jgi:hypothetical protein|nr:DUF3267 domain-containing protein [Treponema sp.]